MGQVVVVGKVLASDAGCEVVYVKERKVAFNRRG